ncbi:MAG TPA: NUDIX hydrolase [Polyangiaceae bacterium]|nr:NUDIX hydrolase [Polyangiaceae bacterium]
MKVPTSLWKVVKEVARHLLRRPVVGIAAAARVADGRWLLVRRADSGGWALPGGTLEWGETLRDSIRREILEETGAEVLELGRVLGVYSRPDRDPRFHAVTILVEATVLPPTLAPHNALEIREVRLFPSSELPGELSHGMTDMLRHAQNAEEVWE